MVNVYLVFYIRSVLMAVNDPAAAVLTVVVAVSFISEQ